MKALGQLVHCVLELPPAPRRNLALRYAFQIGLLQGRPPFQRREQVGGRRKLRLGERVDENGRTPIPGSIRRMVRMSAWSAQ